MGDDPPANDPPLEGFDFYAEKFYNHPDVDRTWVV